MRTSNWKGFQSPLAEPINRYLEYKRALCKKYISQEQSLRLFDAYLVNAGLTSIEQVTSQVVDKFLASRPPSRPNTHNQLIGALRRLFGWMKSQGMLNVSVLQLRKRRATEDLKPYILSHDEVKRLLVMTSQLRDATSNARGRARKYQMIFALAYGLGLRVGEICGPQVGDIDFDRAVVIIKQSKFSKTRLVPMGPKLAQRLNEFLVESGSHENSDPVFSALGDQRALSRNTITVVFHHSRYNIMPYQSHRQPLIIIFSMIQLGLASWGIASFGSDSSSLCLTLAELPKGFKQTETHDHVADDSGTFGKCSGTSSGLTVFQGPEEATLQRVVDIWWVFPSTDSAENFFNLSQKELSEGMPAVTITKAIGDQSSAYGGETNMLGESFFSWLYVVRRGKVVVKVYGSEGPMATSHPTLAMLEPIAEAAARHCDSYK